MRGFIPIRRGIEDHLISGKIGAFELGVYTLIHLQADYSTGVWTGSAARLLATAPRGGTLRDMQRALNRLVKVGFIRVFHRHGVRGNYPVLIDKYEPRIGALKGTRLNAAKSESWHKPSYEVCAVNDAVDGAVRDTERVGEHAPIQEERGEGKNKTENETEVPLNVSVGKPREVLLEIVSKMPEHRRRDSQSFRGHIERHLKALGWELNPEWRIEDRGDGQPGLIDLVITAPQRIAIEFDRAEPREKSLFKLSRFDGLRFVVLRGQKGSAASVLDVTESTAMMDTGRSEAPKDRTISISPSSASSNAKAVDMTPEEAKQAFADARSQIAWLADRKAIPE